MNRLRELAALLQPPVQQVTEAKTMMGDWQGIRGVVEDAIADLEDKLAEGGALETFMDEHGFTDMDTVADKDGKLILERMMIRTQQYKAELEHLMDEIEIIVTTAQAPAMEAQVDEMADSHRFTSGGAKSDRAKALVAAFKAGKETYDMENGDRYEMKGRLNARQLKKGMIVMASYNSVNQGAQIYEIMGFTDNDKSYGEGGVKFDSLVELMKAKNVVSIRELEKMAMDDPRGYGYGFYMVVKDLEDREEGPWFYFSGGRIVRGSGAEPLSFTEVRKVEESTNEGLNHMGEKEQTTYAGWKRACKQKHSECWFEGDADIAQAFVGPKPYKKGETKAVGEWDGAVGSVFKD